MKSVENISKAELNKIKALAAESYQDSDFFREFGEGEARADLVKKYISLMIDYLYECRGLYINEDRTCVMGMLYSDEKHKWPDLRQKFRTMRRIPKQVRRAFAQQAEETAAADVQFISTTHLNVLLMCVAKDAQGKSISREMIKFGEDMAAVRSIPVLFHAYDVKQAEIIRHYGLDLYNKSVASNGVTRYSFVWRSAEHLSPVSTSHNVYLVNSAEVGEAWVSLLERPLGEDQILVFYNGQTPTVSAENVRIISERGTGHVTWVRSGDESATPDLQMSTQLGYMAAKAPENHYYIVSSNALHSPVLNFWNQREISVGQITASQIGLPLQGGIDNTKIGPGPEPGTAKENPIYEEPTKKHADVSAKEETSTPEATFSQEGISDSDPIPESSVTETNEAPAQDEESFFNEAFRDVVNEPESETADESEESIIADEESDDEPYEKAEDFEVLDGNGEPIASEIDTDDEDSF